MNNTIPTDSIENVDMVLLYVPVRDVGQILIISDSIRLPALCL